MKIRIRIARFFHELFTRLASSSRYCFDCPYWEDTECTGLNCCANRRCIYARQYQPWLFEDDESEAGADGSRRRA